MKRFEYRIVVQSHGRDNWEHMLLSRQVGQADEPFMVMVAEQDLSTGAFVDIVIIDLMQRMEMVRPECVKAIVLYRDAIAYLKGFRTGMRRLKEARVARGETA